MVGALNQPTKGFDMADEAHSTPRKSKPSVVGTPKVGGKTATKAAGADSKKAPGKTKKRRLGRGIGSLLSIPVDVDSGAPRPEAKPKEAAPGGRIGAFAEASEPIQEATQPVSGASEGPGERLVHLLQVDLIQPNPYQPRTDFDDGALEELAQSIDRSGLMQPIVVRSTGNQGGQEGWQLVAGERRLRAIKQLGRETIPAIVMEVGDQEAAELALIENLQREDLNPLERASALAHLRDKFGMSQQDLAEHVGLDRSSVANLLRILELDDFCAAAVRRGTLSLGHAKALLGITDDVMRRTTAAAALNAGWSVRELERRVRHLLKPITSKKDPGSESPITTRQANVIDLERRLGEILGMRVNITLGRTKGSGKLQVEFTSLEQFDKLTDLLGLGPDEPT